MLILQPQQLHPIFNYSTYNYNICWAVAGSLEGMFSLEGQVAVITGASRGMGFAMAKKLAEVGAHSVLLARSTDALKANVQTLTDLGLQASFHTVDCTNEAEITAVMKTIAETHGRIDILINNAGTISRKPVTETTAEDWMQVMNLNLNGAFFLAREAARYMEQAKYGRIVNTLSALSVMGRQGVHAYTASKHGLHGLTKSMAAELGPKGITVNGIGPGYIKTEVTDALQKNADFTHLVESRTPVGRWGEANEMDSAVVFLCSPMSAYVNGHMLMVDGGFTSTVCNN